MNESLQKALAEILTVATKGVEAGISFLSEQLPDVARQVLIYNLSVSIFYTILCMLGYILIVVGFFKCKASHDKESKDYNYDPFPIWGTWFFVSMAIFIPATAAFCSNVKNILMITLAPKLYLIEYVARLVKN